jgi:hypothetical protein
LDRSYLISTNAKRLDTVCSTVFYFLKLEGVIVFNPNQNSGTMEPEQVHCASFLKKTAAPREQLKRVKILHNESNAKHVLYVWDNFVTKAQASVIGCVAHSAGGGCAQELVHHRGTVYADTFKFFKRFLLFFASF